MPDTPATTDVGRDPDAPIEMVVINMMIIVNPSSPRQPWRQVVRLQAGWTGATLAKYEHGGYDLAAGLETCVNDLKQAWQTALDLIDPF